MDPASLPSVDAPFLTKNEEFGITGAIKGTWNQRKETTEARKVAAAFGEGEVQQGYRKLITMGVVFVNLLWSKDFWRERARDRLIWPERAFSFSERQIWLSVKRALSLFSSPQANLVNFQKLKQLLMKYELVNGNGHDRQDALQGQERRGPGPGDPGRDRAPGLRRKQ